MHKGRRYWVTCADLGLRPEHRNKEASYQAANEWWTKKLAELNAAQLAAHPHADRLKELEARKQYAVGHGLVHEADVIDAEYRLVHEGLTGDVSIPTMERAIDFLNEAKLPVKLIDIPLPVLNEYFSDKAVWNDRLKKDAAATPKDRTVGALAARWLERLRQKVDDGKLTVHGPADAPYRLKPFLDLIGRDSDPNTLTADLWERFRDRLEGANRRGEVAPGWVKKQWQGTRDYIQWLYANHHLQELPRNYPTLRLKVSSKPKIDPCTLDELAKLYAAARGQHRLHILLGLNCGYYPWDVSILKPENVNLDAGTITHRRTKTLHKTDDAPTVTYRLWPETVALLRQYMAADGPHALLNADGKPWIRYTPKADGKVSETDGIRQWWDRVFKRAGVRYRSFRSLRQTGASGLESDHRWQGIVTYYLANTRTDVTGRYARPSDALLADALDWLRLHLGIDRLPA